MAGECALCLLPPNCPSNTRKIKRVFGVAAVKERNALCWLFAKKNVPWPVLKDNAYLCIFCQRLALRIDRVQQELSAAVSEAELKIEHLVMTCKLITINQLYLIIFM